jgi:flagellar basal body-associated protein FliL
MSKTPQYKKREQPTKGAPRSENKLVTIIVVTAFIATVVSASAVLLVQRFFEIDPASVAQIAPPQAAPTPVQPKAGQKFAYFDFPKLTVFLKKNGSRQPALANIRVTAEFIDAALLPVTKTAQPRIVDAMQAFLRDRSREDLDGRTGTETLRQAFLDIVNNAIEPHQANAVLFKEIVIQ